MIMADIEKEKKRYSNPRHRKGKDRPAEEEPAAEWGERMESAKTIARGGKAGGTIEGAKEQKPS